MKYWFPITIQKFFIFLQMYSVSQNLLCYDASNSFFMLLTCLFNMPQLKWRMKMAHVYLMCCGKFFCSEMIRLVIKLRPLLQFWSQSFSLKI